LYFIKKFVDIIRKKKNKPINIMSTNKVCIIKNCLYDILYLSVIEGNISLR